MKTRKIISQDEYNDIKNYFISNNFYVREIKKSEQNLKLIVNNNSFIHFTNNLHFESLSNIQFSKFYNIILKDIIFNVNSKNIHELIVESKNKKIKEKNLDVWNKVKIGEFFINIDIKNAYWQSAYKLGYISEDLYKDYEFLDEYKEAKRYVFSLLSRDVECNYYNDGNKVNKIKCNNLIFKNMLKNIRNFLSNSIYDICSGVDNNSIIEYNIDAIYCLYNNLDIIRKMFYEKNIKFKITLCKKTSENAYIYNYTLKFFK
ncbi:MAG: hypothetical protein QXM96_01610 [Candidatus Woesearchaeota archaeon]